MGGTASALVTALTLPPTTPVAWVRSFAAGIVGAVRHPARRTAGWPGATWAPADGSTPQ